MNSKIVNAIISRIANSFDARIFKSGVVFYSNDLFFSALLIEKSSVIHNFYVNLFVMPFFVPQDTINLGFGTRIRNHNGIELWDSRYLNISDEITQIILSKHRKYLDVRDLKGFSLLLNDFTADNIYVMEAFAITSILLCDTERGINILDDLYNKLDSRIKWQNVKREYVNNIRNAVKASNESFENVIEETKRTSKLTLSKILGITL